MSDFADQLRKRTKKFAIEIIRFCQTLSDSPEVRVIKYQLIKSATSVAANYRAVCRGRSNAEFYSKLCICVEESDESLFWLEVIDETGLSKDEKLKHLMKEAGEILAILSTSKKTTKEKTRSNQFINSPTH